MNAVRVDVNDASVDLILPMGIDPPFQAEGSKRRGEERETLQDDGPVYDVHFSLACGPH